MIKRILATFLAVITVLGCMSLTLGIAAETVIEDAENAPVYEYNTSYKEPTMYYLTGKVPSGKYSFDKVTTAAQKLETMDLRLQKGDYRLYVDAYSGEIAVENIVTKETLFSNPYDVGAVDKIGNNPVQASEKPELLSQFIIEYVDVTAITDATQKYNSFAQSVRAGETESEEKKQTVSQIVVKEIRDGLRLEYSIGRKDARYLAPDRIPAEIFEEKILGAMKANGASESFVEQMETIYYEKVKAYKDAELEATSQKEIDALKAKYEAYGIKDFETSGAFYVTKATAKKQRIWIESRIKEYCPDFTLQEMDAAHEALGYTPKDRNEPLFKVSIEYTLTDDGLSARIPANGIRFDESIYRLENIIILPYMGAVRNPSEGYCFFPDGSGALFDFEEHATKKNKTSFYGDVYGQDFAYYNIGTSTPHNEIIRYPVYGIKEGVKDENGNVVHNRGFVAIVEEGESMMRIETVNSSKYHTVQLKVNPRPYDKYKLSGSISASGSNKPLAVVSERKYTGDIKIKYIMLTDPEVKSGKGYYETSYVGMAKAYREYLKKNGVLTALEDTDVRDNIPLFVETLGALETTEKFLTIPYDTMKTLTSFEDIRKMYDDLALVGQSDADAAEKIENINFILNGFTKGGLTTDYVPYSLKWDSSVKKEMSFEDLVAYAKSKKFGVYLDADFVFAGSDGMFDGLNQDKHIVRGVDDKYMAKREYYATRQTYVSFYEYAISPAYFNHFYEKFAKNYDKYSPTGISVSTLGSYLNSDFDEDEAYNREDNKGFTVDALEFFDNKYDKVVTSEGNAYSWKYVDYITDIATDSSRHARSSATVPFLGIVLHGYIQTASDPINMEGNMDYAMLRAIENGTSPKFVLAYQNTSELKQYTETNKYYSVRYDVWREELVERYHEMNNILKDVQTSTIDSHEFLVGERIPEAEEILEDAETELFNRITAEIRRDAAKREEARKINEKVRNYTGILTEQIMDGKGVLLAAEYLAKADGVKKAFENVTTAEAEAAAAKEAYETEARKPLKDATDEEKKAKEELLEQLRKTKDEKAAAHTKAIEDAKTAYAECKAYIGEFDGKYIEPYNFVAENIEFFVENSFFADAEKEAVEKAFRDIEASVDYAAISSDAFVAARASIDEMLKQIEKDNAELLGIDPEAEEKTEEDKAETETAQTKAYNKYEAQKNSIVLEKYSNGKTLLLNFNDYAVKVKVGEDYYRVDGYGYLILSGGRG